MSTRQMEAIGIYRSCRALELDIALVTCSRGITIACSGALDKSYSVTLLLNSCCPFLEVIACASSLKSRCMALKLQTVLQPADQCLSLYSCQYSSSIQQLVYCMVIKSNCAVAEPSNHHKHAAICIWLVKSCVHQLRIGVNVTVTDSGQGTVNVDCSVL